MNIDKMVGAVIRERMVDFVPARERQRSIDLVAKHLTCLNKHACDYSMKEENCLEIIIAEILAGDK